MAAMDYVSHPLVLIAVTSVLFAVLYSRRRKPSNRPPGPFPLPIIGNILSLGPKPHQSLAKLSRKYGPVMSLKLGAVTTVVISSPESARAVLQKHDVTFSNRKLRISIESQRHHKFSLAWRPVDATWRDLRRICREQMFSAARLDAFEGLRRNKLDQLRGYVKSCRDSGRAVDIGDAAFTTSLNVLSTTLFSKDFAEFGTVSSQEIRDVVCGVMRSVGRTNMADFFPVLKRIDPQGILRDCEYYFGRLFEIFDGIIDERLKCRNLQRDDFLESLMDLNQKGELNRDNIKHLLLDLFVAGTDTTSSTVEWAMTELIRNPSKLSKLRNEINSIIGGKIEGPFVEESDIPILPYLQAVVMETLRLHPPAPFLLPRNADLDVAVNNVIVPKDAEVLVNVWATGRDPNVWVDAEEFIPERFLAAEHEVSYRGSDFKMIPFGAGRRICPGLPLAHRTVHLMLATLVGGFEWQLEGGVKSTDLDMDDKFGITVHKAIPLKAIPMKL